MHHQIGAHLYIFSKSQPDWDATLGALNEAGYYGVEGFVGDLKVLELCRKHGLQFVAAHITPPQLSELDALCESLDQTGVRDLCSSGLMNWHERSHDDYQRTIEVLNAKGEALRRRGIFLHYHNHEFEFERDETGVRGCDLLGAGLDFGAVDFCLDAGWVDFAGVDSAQWMRDHALQIGFLHLRDFKDKISGPLGRGDVDLAAQIATLSDLTNLRGIMVEQDPNTNEPLQALLQSRAYLKEQFGI